MCVFNMNTALQQSKDYSVAGQYLYKSIKEAIANNDRLSVDMDGVTSLPSVFLNVSLGRIIDEEGKDKLKQYVGFVKITKQQALRLRTICIGITNFQLSMLFVSIFWLTSNGKRS